MLQPPRSPNEPILIARHWKNITLYGFSISAVVIGILVYAHFILELPNKLVNNLAFYTYYWHSCSMFLIFLILVFHFFEMKSLKILGSRGNSVIISHHNNCFSSSFYQRSVRSDHHWLESYWDDISILGRKCSSGTNTQTDPISKNQE